MNELKTADRWMKSVLSAFGNVYYGVAPLSAACPYIVFYSVSGADLEAADSHVWTEFRYHVKVWGTSFEDDLFDSVTSALDRQGGITTDFGYIQSCRRESVMSNTEEDDGVFYYSREAEYIIRVKR